MVEFSLANLMSFYNEITSMMDDGGAMDIVFLAFSKSFETVSCLHREAVEIRAG